MFSQMGMALEYGRAGNGFVDAGQFQTGVEQAADQCGHPPVVFLHTLDDPVLGPRPFRGIVVDWPDCALCGFPPSGHRV